MNSLKALLTVNNDKEDCMFGIIKILEKIFDEFNGYLEIKLWEDTKIKLGNQPIPKNGSTVTIIFKTPNVLISFLKKKDPLSFAESYFNGEIDIEGNIEELFLLRDEFSKLHVSWLQKIRGLKKVMQFDKSKNILPKYKKNTFLFAPSVKDHNHHESSKSVEYHYDISNSFYELWLDSQMIYSCAYFSSIEQDLEEAQIEKLDLICRKLQLQKNDDFLDIGCGWGGLLIHAAKKYGVNAYGITLSKKQYDYALDRIIREGLLDRVIIELKDYRDIATHYKFNKISSIGMFEHVGIKNQKSYFNIINNLLTEDGLFINHGITSDAEGWKKSIGQRFINKYVFPDGQLDTISNVQRHMEAATFEIIDVECLRKHYVITLDKWIKKLSDSHSQALNYVPESTYRIWLTYMIASKQSFENGSLGVYQILTSHHGVSCNNRPLNRVHMNVEKSHITKFSIN